MRLKCGPVSHSLACRAAASAVHLFAMPAFCPYSCVSPWFSPSPSLFICSQKSFSLHSRAVLVLHVHRYLPSERHLTALLGSLERRRKPLTVGDLLKIQRFVVRFLQTYLIYISSTVVLLDLAALDRLHSFLVCSTTLRGAVPIRTWGQILVAQLLLLSIG